MSKKLRLSIIVLGPMVLVLLLIIFFIEKPKEGHKEETGGELNLTRWASGYSERSFKVNYDETFGESFERHYNGVIDWAPSKALIGGLKSSGKELSQDELVGNYTETLEELKLKLEQREEFDRITIDPYDNLLQLAAVTDSRRNQFSVNYRTDGSVQAIYYTIWQSSGDIPDVSTIVTSWKDYVGVTLSSDDLLRCYTDIKEVANFGGTYSVFVNDNTRYAYFALSVHDYDTSNEYWECYISVAAKY